MNQLTYTAQELAQINECVWSDPPSGGQASTNVPCPACGADTRVLISWSSAGDSCGALVLIATCYGCKRSGRVRPAENRCPNLDENQMRAVVEGYLRGQRVFCPTCGTPLDIEPGHTFGEFHYSAYCYRGGAMGQLGLPR